MTRNFIRVLPVIASDLPVIPFLNMSRKKIIEIHTYNDDEFMDALADRVAEKVMVQLSSQLEEEGAVSLNGPCWQKSATAQDHFQVSRPTLKAMRERGEIEFTQVGRSYRYNICG